MKRRLAQPPWLAIVAIGALAIALLNVWWVIAYRDGYPLTIDEAGYIAFGLADHFGFQAGGLGGWWDAVNAQAPYAPLVPAATSVLLEVHTGTLPAFGTLIAFLVLLIFATYGIGERLAGSGLGALAALVVGLAPGAFLFTREYVFALPVAALLSCAVYALLRSDGLRSWRWSLAGGVLIGLMLLARTMTVAFVPAILLAGAVAIVTRAVLVPDRPDDLGKRILNLILMALTGLAVAATWYLPNFDSVFDYLTDYGYGGSASYYGPGHSWLSWGRWRDVANRMVDNDLLIPLALLILAALVVLAVAAVRSVRAAPDRRREIVRLLSTDAFSVALVIGSCFVALTSSRNGGEGFTVPISLLIPPFAVLALRHVGRRAAIAAIAATLAITALNLVANSNVSDSLARKRTVDVPAFGELAWINGTPLAVSAVRGQVPGPAARFGSQDEAWVRANEELAAFAHEQLLAGAAPPVTFASRNRALNTSTLLLAGWLQFREPFYLAQMTASPDSVASYERQLSELANPGILVTMSDETGDFDPVITQSFAETAARELGYRVIRRIPLPNGEEMRIWSPRQAPA